MLLSVRKIRHDDAKNGSDGRGHYIIQLDATLNLALGNMETSLVQTIKLVVVNGTGLSKDALHIFFGLAAFFLVSIGFRMFVWRLLPVAAVAVLALLGESVDMLDDFSNIGYWRWRASLHDILNTTFWPAVIYGLAPYSSAFGSVGRS